MSEEQLKELQEYNLEYLEAQQSEEIFGGDYTSAVELKYAKKEIERLNNIIEKLDKQNGELGADLSIIKDRVIKTNWWLENMLKQATNKEIKAIINGTLDLLLGSDKE